MMKLWKSSVACLVATLLVFAADRPVEPFSSVQKQAIRASVTIGGPSGSLTLNAPRLLPQEMFFGNNVVIPIEVNSAAAPSAIDTSMVYQLLDGGGNPLTPAITVPIPLQVARNTVNSRVGIAFVPVRDLLPARHDGQFSYFLQASQGGQQASIKNNGAPFQVRYVDSMSFPVDQQARVVSIPDSYMTDGATAISFSANALSGPGTLIVRMKDPATVPAGPGGLSPVMVFDFELQGTSLLTQTQMTLVYPANLDGTLIGSNGSALNLAPYRLDALNWTLLAPRQVDTTQHTITFPTPHLSQYALFVSGATTASDLRPRQRILTPNGDGINDTIDFSGIGASATVQLFDIKGRRIRTLSAPTLAWDGRDDSGSIVESGLYLYQFTALGERVSGLILIAK